MTKKDYDIKYQREHYQQLSIRLLPEEKALIMQGAQAAGLSVRAYLLMLAAKDQQKT